jgi:hypothetical protein
MMSKLQNNLAQGAVRLKPARFPAPAVETGKVNYRQ